MGEYDNTGFPLTYCLLSMAEALEIGKWKKALNNWAAVLQDRYGIILIFVHTDKDMAEIGMLRDIWLSVKIQFCWWHLWKAVQEWLSKNKLSTTPYNAKRAHLKYAFINTSFIPSGHSDPHKYEGGMHDVIADIDEEPLQPSPNMISILIKPPPKPHNLWPHMAANITANSSRVQPKPEDVSDEEDEQRIFCPEEHHGPIVDMMEAHLCTHPLIPEIGRASCRERVLMPV